jgi:hypothetical protein
MGHFCDPAVMIAAVMIALLAGSGGAVAYDKQSGLVHLFNHTTCRQYAEDRRLPEGVGRNGFDKLYIAGFLTAANVYVEGVNIDSTEGMLDNVMLWLDTYCRTNASSTMQGGLIELIRQRSAKARR